MTVEHSYYFSKTTRGFYYSGVHTSIPEDAVRISDQKYRELMESQASLGEIQYDDDGMPVPAKKPDSEELRRIFVNQIKEEAHRLILKVSPIWQQLNDLRIHTDAGQRRFDEIDRIRKASNLIEEEMINLSDEELDRFTPVDHPLFQKASSLNRIDRRF